MIDWTQVGLAFVAGGGVITVILTALLSRKDRAVVRYEKLVNDLSEDVKRLREENTTLRKELAEERAASKHQGEQIFTLQTKLDALERQLRHIAAEHPNDSPLNILTKAIWGQR